ncbi:MAG: hypothetical protein P8144_12005 [Gammaproteobacteria bacterium]
MNKPITLKDQQREAILIKNRLVVAACIVVLACVILVARLAYLQIFQYERFTTASEENRI